MLSYFRVEPGQALDDLLSEMLAAMMAEGRVNPERVWQDALRRKTQQGGLRVRASAV